MVNYVAKIIVILVYTVMITLFQDTYSQDSYSNANELDYDYNDTIYGDDEKWWPYLTVINTIIDIEKVLNYNHHYISSKKNRFNPALDLERFFLMQECCDDERLVILFIDVEYLGSINIDGVLQSSLVTSAVRNILNLDLPIFKPIMFPWDYYLKEHNVYLDYKISFGRKLTDYLIKDINIRVFYFFR